MTIIDRPGYTITINVHLVATYLPINVFPVPGGPNNSKPLGGPLKPVNMSLETDNIYICPSI